ncbi:hypothetical protein Bra3105_00775 [Brachybacterium halotolerans subsp. kimchii]|uniref:hypothetical protein n=1 Tax=Brachybacterium halotolerans TaxID=2795215 RepID=UPI001E65616A|nr:hypothetical protein [Brachybacterium halotolerans]UEJ82900.1 hypothetical protein Bra3105_00775 [Brachybacterium halotolerans subsp. kimchii]
MTEQRAAGDGTTGDDPLVRITGDGTWQVPTGQETTGQMLTGHVPIGATGGRDARTTGGASDLTDADADRLLALTRLRGLLGDDLEQQIATRLFLPAALGTEGADQLLPQSLTLLAGTTGDLASYGWRIGPGSSRTWRRAQELRERLLEAARIALHGYEGDLVATTLGPLTLAAATFLGSGERTLADRGALRDLPHLLAEGIAEHLDAVRSHVPGARPRLLIRDGAALALAHGAIPTPSEYRRYPALPVPDIGEVWRTLLEDLRSGAGLDVQDVTLAPSSDTALLRAARTAGATRLALSPAGFCAWELLAELREAGVGIELVVDPAGPQRLEAQLGSVARSWRELGFRPRDLAGFTWLAHRPDRAVGPALPGGGTDPSAEPSRASLLDESDLQTLLRAAPAWAERVEG